MTCHDKRRLQLSRGTNLLIKLAVIWGLLRSKDVSETPPRREASMRSHAVSQSSLCVPVGFPLLLLILVQWETACAEARCGGFPLAFPFSSTPLPLSRYTSARSNATLSGVCAPSFGVPVACNTGKRASAPCA